MRQFISLTLLLLLIIVIPLSVYLVQEKQIFKGRASYNSSSPAAGAFEIGIEAGEQHDTSRVGLVAESKAPWVRLNFVGDDWSLGSNDVVVYNSIINAYTGKGVKIIGLIGAQSVPGGYDRTQQSEFSSKFTDTATTIINRFGDRVKTYELFNEPNDWAGGTSAQVSPRYLAEYLARVYRQIKITEKKNDITLISGPLFSFDLANGADYLGGVYSEGKSLEDRNLNWETIKQTTGSYPLDGIGYHIYVAQGMNDKAQLTSKMQANLNSIKSVINNLDPGKKIWITEFGWGTGDGRVTEDVQSENLEAAFNILKNDGSVKMAMWFTLIDFDDSRWGLIDTGGTKKKAWAKFTQIVQSCCAVSFSDITPTPTSRPTPTPTTAASNTPSPTLRPTATIFPTGRVTPTATPTPTSKPSSTSTLTPTQVSGNRTNSASSPLSKAFPTLMPEKARFDYNSDLKVNSIDVGLFFEGWLKNDTAAKSKYDANSDGVINTMDYSRLVKNLAQ